MVGATEHAAQKDIAAEQRSTEGSPDWGFLLAIACSAGTAMLRVGSMASARTSYFGSCPLSDDEMKSDVLCVRVTLEDQSNNVYAWRIVPQSVEQVEWPEALRARAEMEGWVTKRTPPFWHPYGDAVPETQAEVWQVIATDLYNVTQLLAADLDPVDPDQMKALRAMAAYDAEMGWLDDEPARERVVVEMPVQPEAYLG